MDTFFAIRMFVFSSVAFAISIVCAPLLTHYLYKYQCWKKKARTEAPDGSATPIFTKLHGTAEVSTPRMGGILVWGTTLILTGGVFLLSWILPSPLWDRLNFLSREQTWIPFFTLISASLLGLIDDILVILGIGPVKKGAGLSFRIRAFVVLLIGMVGAYWFYQKLGWHTLHVPFWGDISLGIWYAPFFIFMMLAVFSGGVIDGLDGLAGGSFSTIFATFAAMAFVRGQYDLAVLCAVIVGALLGFLWFNIPPARFYMGETGSLGLTTTIAVIAFITDSVILLLVIGFLIFLEAASVAIQLTSKKLFGKKVFLSAPIHHHFEALGWPKHKITMRFWVIGFMAAVLGLSLFLLDHSMFLSV